MSWRQASSAPPAPPEVTFCAVQFWVTKRHVFAVQYYQNTRVPDAIKAARTYTSFFRSDDGGGTWTRLDAAMPPGGATLYLYPMHLADGDTLLMSDPYYVSNGHGGEDDWGTRLWRTRDAGQSWQLMATLSQNDGSVPVRALGVWSGSPTLSHPLYVLGDTIDSHHFHIVIEQVSDLQHWSRLPPLPVAGATADRLGVTTVLAETSSGKLLALGVGPHNTVPAAGADPAPGTYDQQWLWEWDPRAVHWIGIAPALQSPWPLHCSDHCFAGMLSQGRDPVHADTYLWIGSSGWDSNILSRLLLPAGT